MSERDMMELGYFQNIPGSYSYGNYGFQGPPGSLYPMQNNIMNNPYNQNNIINNPLLELNTKINNLENRIKILEQKINKQANNSYQDDNSMYML